MLNNSIQLTVLFEEPFWKKNSKHVGINEIKAFS